MKIFKPLLFLKRFAPNDIYSWQLLGDLLVKIVKIVLVGCISRLQGQKIGFKYAILKSLKPQSPELLYLAYNL